MTRSRERKRERSPAAKAVAVRHASEIQAGGDRQACARDSFPTRREQQRLPPSTASRAINDTAGRSGSRTDAAAADEFHARELRQAPDGVLELGRNPRRFPRMRGSKVQSAGSATASHRSTDSRNEATMIAIATIREKLATIAARLTIA
jgi:hypothetical protein